MNLSSARIVQLETTKKTLHLLTYATAFFRLPFKCHAMQKFGNQTCLLQNKEPRQAKMLKNIEFIKVPDKIKTSKGKAIFNFGI